jgi:predicted nucleic acid-binding protein
MQMGRPDVASKYETLLVHFPHLTICDIDRHIARRAAQLQAEYRLRPADALQVAACLDKGIQVYISNDRRLNRLETLIPIFLLDDLAD